MIIDITNDNKVVTFQVVHEITSIRSIIDFFKLLNNHNFRDPVDV